MLIKPLPDGGAIALDLEKVIAIVTPAVYDTLLAVGLADFHMKEVGQCHYELPNSKVQQVYQVYEGTPIREVQ